MQETPGSIAGLGGSPKEEMQPSPVFLLGESYGQRSFAGYSPCSRKSRTQLSD